MADNLGGLFDSDPGFLEELASGTEETQPQQMQGMIPQQTIGMMPSVQQQQQPGYNNLANNLPANNFGTMQFQNQQQQAAPQQPQQQFCQTNFNQYNNQPIYNQNAMVATSHGQQTQAHMMTNSSQQSQFGNPGTGMIQHQGQVMYQYNAGGAGPVGPTRLPNPAQPQQPPPQQQQMKVMQIQGGWNQNPQPQLYNQQQQAQQSQTQYLSHHDYAVSSAAGAPAVQQPQIHLQQPQQQQQCYTTSQPQQNQAAFMQRMASPTRIQPQQPAQGMQSQMFQQNGNQNFGGNGMTPGMGNDGSVMMQQAQQSQPQQPQAQQFLPQAQQATAGQYQQFQYRSPPQNLQQNMAEKMGNAVQQPNLMRFPQTSPTQPQQNVHHMQQFNNLNAGVQPQQRAPNPMLSPRPNLPPQSPSMNQGMLSPTGSTSSHQGNPGSMEPSPQPQQSNNMTIFQQNSIDTVKTNQLNFSSPPSNNAGQLASPTLAQPNGNMNLSVTTNFPNNQGQVSPGYKVLSPKQGGSPQQVMTAEVQALNQQIQQLYSLPQTPQTQQKLLDLQEKLRLLKLQQPNQRRQGKAGKNAQQQQIVAQPQQIQIQSQMQPGTNPLQGQQQIQMQPGTNQMQVVQTGQQSVQQPMQGQTAGTVTFKLSGSGPGKATQLQPGSKIHLVPASSGQQKVIIIQPNKQGQTVVTNPVGTQPAIVGSQPQTMVAQSSLPQPQQAQHIIINSSPAPGAPTQRILIQNATSLQPTPGSEIKVDGNPVVQKQEKANKIIAEAIAKAQKAGNTAIPRVLEPPDLPATLGDVENPEMVIAEEVVKPKKKRRNTPKKDKDGKEKTPRKRTKKEKKAAAAAAEEAADAVIAAAMRDAPDDDPADTEKNVEVDIMSVASENEKPKKPKRKRPTAAEKRDRTPKSTKKVNVNVNKPPATFIKNKNKRKRKSDSDGSEVEIKVTPPPSPENDDLKRRSGRHAKRKKYLDDVDLNLSEEEIDKDANNDGAVVKPVQIVVDNPTEEDAVVVDKILGARIRKRDPDDENDADEEEAEEYFIKYKNYSYLHCEWKTEAEIKDKRIQSKIRRFRQKKLLVTSYFEEEEEYFNADYVEVDRVLEESFTRDPTTDEEVIHYLVKWRSLPYEDSTWELQQDVDPEKVKLFKKFRELPSAEERKYKVRPKSADWVALDKSHSYKNKNCLREYQLEGVNWLTFCWHKKNNCILADEMGLGKTIQSIAYLQEIFTYGIRGPFLVVAPLSTIANWQREFETWTDMNAITYHGNTPSRYMLQEYEMYFRTDEGTKIKDCYRFHALITTYELILSDIDLLKTIQWRALVVDEAHRLKNKNCSLIKCLRIFNCEHKVLLSGTPLQNNVEELFSLLNFLEPNQFNCAESFNSEFGTLNSGEQVEKLKAILKPMMLRRLKEDVEKNLAAKEETIIEVELTNIQKKYYRAILERNFSYLCKGSQSSGNIPSLMNTMMELRKCCNHPYLINGAEDNILAEMRSKEKKEPEHIQALIQSSGKFVLLDKLLPKLKQNGNRVLIFSQMIRVLDIIEDYLIHKRYLYERLDGRIRGNMRQEAIDRYSKPDSDRFVFLICTKAGGLGINLTAADTVIIYDSDWNPQNDLQAQARCHRIGQSKMVMVYRLITRNSYEREMFDRASMKLGLDKAVLQSMSNEKVGPQMALNKKEIEDLLKKGAYGALMEDDNAGDKFCEEDIDQILKGRTQVIQIESEGKGSTFAKASFSVTSNRDDIDINDPEFWQKWAKKADMDMENLDKKELIVDEPRVRKKTARYGNNDGLADISDLGSDSNTEEEGESTKKGRKGRRGRRGNDDDDDDFEKEKRKKSSHSGYTRSELFKVEKGLLHYGWGRWKDIMAHTRFKRHMDEKDIEMTAKAILLFGLQYYKGDERIKEFIWDLISHGEGLKNHSGLSAPVPRGRKGKKAKNEESGFNAFEEIDKAGIKIDKDIVMNKNAYKRHISRHSNKVLLRVRTLFYLKHEVLGDVVEQIDEGRNVKDITLTSPMADNEPPVYWWDELADKSLLIGVYKHGYEKYNVIRQDPCLVFLSRCGPPDNAALAAEMNDDEGDDMDDTIINDEEESLPAPDREMTPKPTKEPVAGVPMEDGEEGKLPFPTPSEMNTRLRRIITNYQRDYKKQQLKIQQQAKKMEKREKLDAIFKEREARRRETMQKWTRREEMDFYRVVSTYGIEFDRVKGRYIWDRFRVMAKLDKKTDEQLTEYFISFYHMCLRVCRKIKEEAYPPTPVYIEPITEERANRCIARIDLLSKIREEIIIHPRMETRIRLCKMSVDLPTWWNSGKHDRELLVGAAKHGLARTDLYIMNDANLCFRDDIKEFMKTQRISPSTPTFSSKDLLKKEDADDDENADKKPDKDEESKSDDKSSVKKEEKDAENEASVKTEDGDDDKDTIKTEKDTEEKSSSEDVKKEVKTEDDKDGVKETDKEVKEEDMETEETEVKKEAEDSADDKSDVVKTEMEVDEESDKEGKVKKEEVDTAEEKKEKAGVKKEEKEVKEEKDSEEKVKIEDDDKDDVKTEDLKDDPDEEVRLTMEGEDSQTQLLEGVSNTLLAQWPKDRVVFHRLEQICYCVETGEWPFPSKMKNAHILGIDSGSNTPTRSLTPCATPKQEDDVREGDKGKKKDRDSDTPNESDGPKMTFQSKKSEKHRLSLDSEAEKTAKIQAILAASLAASQASSEDSPQDASFSQSGADSPFLNGNHMSEEEMLLNRSILEHGMMFSRGRRGRKRKAEKMAEIAMAEALARRQTARALASLDSDSRVPVINLEDGSRLSGEEAPRKKEIESWLVQHPGYIVDTRDMDEIEEGEIVPEYPERRKGRKPKFDPAFLDVEKLTGEENVSVINRLTGKKITGAKAPPLRYLAEWLEQNPMWDVDPKWSDLVRAKGSLPKQLLPRVVTPSRRGRRPRDSPLSHSISGVTDPHQAAALAASLEAMNAANLMAGYGKLPLPFGSLPGLGMNPLLGLSGFGFPGLPGASPLATEKSETPSKESSSKEDGEKSKKKKEEEASSSSPHPSFPFMFNPLLYNPALLAAQGLTNFPLPTSLSSASAGLINGHPQKEEEHAKKPSSSKSRPSQSNQAEDLSVKVKKSSSKSVVENLTEAHSTGKKSKSETSGSNDELPCDLSMKPKSKEDKSKQKICSSDKLSRIVDTLKFRVNKMDEKPSKSGHEEKETKQSGVDAALNLKEKAASTSSKKEPTDVEISKKDLLNSLTKKITSHSANHAPKEPLPKIVEELLAAKQQREQEELLAKQQKLDSLKSKKEKLLQEAAAKLKSASSTQGSVNREEVKERTNEEVVNSSPGDS